MEYTFPPSVGGGGGTYPEVADYASLPAAGTVSGLIYVVQTTTGIIGFRKLAGLWRSDGATWNYLGLYGRNAAEITNVPAGTVASGDVQGAINELDGDIQAHIGAGGTHHAAVTTGTNGFMIAADKSKLDGIASGATANSADVVLLARANHTGTQGIATILAASTARIFGRTTAGSGAGEELTAAQVLTLINVAAGATANSPDATLLARANHTGTQGIATVLAAATARLFGRVTAGSGAGEELTGTQATTMLDVFTSVLKGLVPASGGGTTTFLRADGTFAVPAGGGGGGAPGGSTTQIQFNDAGAFGGDADFVWDKTTNTLGLAGANTGLTMAGVTNEPVAPSAGTLRYYSRAVAGRMLPKIKDPSGLDTIMQPAIFQNQILMYVPSTGTTGTGSGAGLGPVWTSGGTVSHPTPASTAPAISNQMRRTRYANVVTTANQTLGIKAAAADTLNYWRGNAAGLGGFFYAARFIVELYPASTVRIFAGLTASSATYVVASDTVLNNTCGLWHDTTDPSTGAGAFNFVTRNAATTTKQQLTLANAIVAGNSYDFYMWCAPNGSEIFWRLDDNVNNVTYEGSQTLTLPVNTAFMGPQCAMSNGTANITVTTSAIGIAGVYTEADR